MSETTSEISSSHHHRTFDDIVEEKIGFGKYQYVLYCFVGLAFAAEAAFIFCFSLVIPNVKHEWHLNENEVSSLGSSIFLGIFMGSVFAGYITDKLGRKQSLLISSCLQLVLGAAVSFVSSYLLFFALRVLFGILIGFTLPLCLSMLSEITTVKLRGKALIFCNIFFTFGRLFVIFSALLTLENLEVGNWRRTVLYCCLLPSVVCFGVLLFVYESPRFEIAFGRVERGIETLRKIGKLNKGKNFVDLNEQDAQDIRAWQETNFVAGEKVSTCTLFNAEYRLITMNLWIMWLTVAFCSYGLNFILPFVLEEQAGVSIGVTETSSSQPKGDRSDFYKLAAPNFIEIPTILVGFLIIEVKVFGRKNTLIICYFCAFVCFLLSMLLDPGTMIPFLSAARFFVSLAFGVIYPFTAELYSTKHRTIGIGMSSAIGRLETVLMPWISIQLMQLTVRAPFGCFAGLCILSAVCGFSLPFDTTGHQLDSMPKKKTTHIELQEETAQQQPEEEVEIDR